MAQLGDPYAKLAADVVQGSSLQKHIRRHWENTVGPTKTALHFTSFAQQHFHQYVEILSTGTWPDADQILNSYLTTARSHNLPEIIVFDAAWTASDFSKFISWQSLNQLPYGRRPRKSRICLTIPRREANQSLPRDFML